MLSDQLQLFKRILPDDGFIMFLKVGFTCRISGQFFTIFCQYVAYS